MVEGGSHHVDENRRSLALHQSAVRVRSAGGVRRGRAREQSSLRLRCAHEEKVCVAGALVPRISARRRTPGCPRQLARRVDRARAQFLSAPDTCAVIAGSSRPILARLWRSGYLCRPGSSRARSLYTRAAVCGSRASALSGFAVGRGAYRCRSASCIACFIRPGKFAAASSSPCLLGMTGVWP
jgi:hypothetical protein